MKIKTVNEYFDLAPEKSLPHLTEMRNALLEILPNAEEVISYNMPTFKQKKLLVHYAASKEHLGYYPTPGPIEAFAAQIQQYKHSKGAVQFPYNQPLPIKLIQEMALHRLTEVLEQ
ncbi:MAG: DUF1801 domain-containing protein [Bacteroidetes bacterium]|nr:DUF1801 domain-containing protein [Bacteroidota bacterium]